IPPLCYGASSASASVSKSKVNGDYASVGEQSGIKAGDGGFQLEVKGSTDLKGGVITSTQAAIDAGKNSLSTKSLTASDIQNKDDYAASGFSVSASVSGKLGDQSSQAAQDRMSDKDKAAAKNAKTGTGLTPGIGQAFGSQGSATKSGISGATITLTGDGTSAPENLKRDVTTDKDSSASLKKAWNGQQLMDDVQAQVQLTQSALPRLANEIGTQMGKKAVELQAQARALPDTDPNKQALLDEAKKYDEGGVYRIAAHGALGATGGGLAGAAGAAGAAAAAPMLDELQGNLQERLTDAGASAGAAKVMAQLITGGAAMSVGAAVSGSSTAGALTAANADFNNRQLHATDKVTARQLVARAKAQGLTNPDGSPITVEQIENAMRSANYDKGNVHETILTGLVVPLNANTKASEIYDNTGMEVSKNGDSAYLVQRSSMLASPSQALRTLIQQGTGGAGSPYSWDSATPEAVAAAATAKAGVSPTSGIHYELRSANGKSFSLPVPDCPAVSCTNGDPIAWYGGTAQDQTTLAAYKEALDKQMKKEAVTSALVVGTVATLPATLTGAVVGGAIVGGGSSAADQVIDKGKVDDPYQVFVETGKGAVLGGLGYGTVVVGGKVLGSVATLDDLFVASTATKVDAAADASLLASGGSGRTVKLPPAADSTATSPYSSKGMQYGSTTVADANGNPVPTGTAVPKAGTVGAESSARTSIDVKSTSAVPEILLPDPPVGNGPRSSNAQGIGFDGYEPPLPTTPNATGTFRAGQSSTLPQHLMDEGGLTQGKNVYGTHDMDAFDQALKINGGSIINKTQIPGAVGIYRIDYQLPGMNPTVKTVFDPAMYPAVDMEKMVQSAAQAALNQAALTGSAGQMFVNVGGEVECNC
ncbi:MAG: hypothetical protein JF606_25935, partial [Burkholderiales bacterium]|nr:hypothetical protein [Burkholderiales bacterium]